MKKVHQIVPPGFSVIDRGGLPRAGLLVGLEVAVPWPNGVPKRGVILSTTKSSVLVEIERVGQLASAAKDLMYRVNDLEAIKKREAERKGKEKKGVQDGMGSQV